MPPYNLALVFAGLHEMEEAFHWLEQAFADRDVHMTFLLDQKWRGAAIGSTFPEANVSCGVRGLDGG